VASSLQPASQRAGAEVVHGASRPRSPPDSQQPSPALDAAAISSTLSLSWLTHWERKEEQRQFRREVFASTRGRQVQRQQWLLDAVSGSSDEEDAETLIVNGRFSVVAPIQQDAASPSPPTPRPPESASSSGEEMDDLTWLASHPEALAQQPESNGTQEGAPDGAEAWAQRAAQEGAAAGAVQLRVGSEHVAVRPLWIAVHQPDGSATARLFESVVPLQDDVVAELTVALEPMCTTSGLQFGVLADARAAGGWANFFVGLVGDVAADEEDILWPNQVLHGDRVLYNVRSAADVARFLADPQLEDVRAHLDNLQRLAEERKYRQGWAGHMLRARWGAAALRRLGVKAP